MIKKWKWFSSLFYHPLQLFLSCPVSHINNSSKTLTKFATEQHTSLKLALNLQYKWKINKIHLLKRNFLHREKDQTKNFSPFWCKRPFDRRKEFLKLANSTYKGSTSNPLQVAFPTRCGGKVGTKLNKKSFRSLFKTQSTNYDGAFLCQQLMVFNR